MNPYYEHAGVTLWHTDWAKIELQPKSHDLLLTDPPYGIGMDGMRQSTSKHGGRKAYEFHGWDDATPSPEDIAFLIGRAKDSVIWGGNYMPSLPPSMGWLVWDKGQRISQSDGELAYTSRQSALRIFTLNRCALATDGAYHVTQKPIALIKWCISLFPEAKSILDPYCGSGTSLVAAKSLGLTATGMEREERYCEIAAKRLSQEVFDFTEAQ